MALQANPAQGDATLGKAPPQSDASTLRDCLRARLFDYFLQLGGQASGDLYDLVMAEIEEPLFQMVLEHTRGNLSRAAEVLGIHRSTLRRKLSRYNLI